jgi:hypothetical protein
VTTAVSTHRRRGAPARKALHKPHRADRHEVEADRAADAAVRGASDLAGTLTPASAASVHVASIGSPLAAPIRGRLEQSFGADLDEVRVHHGAAAAAANRAEHARAFAAGRDIFFGEGAFAPHTEVGYRLLAHEVAHVLQQTARRRGPARRLAATGATGTGLPQFGKLEDLDLKLSGNTELKKLADEHRALYAKTNVDLEHMIEHVVDLLLPAKIDFPLAVRTTVGDTLRDEANKGVDGKTAPPRGFLADCLKLMQPPGYVDYYEAVLAIYDADATTAKKPHYQIRTRRDTGFLDYLKTAKKGDDDWAADSAAHHPRLADFWSRGFFESFLQLLTNPWATPSPLWGTDMVGTAGKAVTQSWEKEKTFLKGLTGPDYTEREMMAMDLIDNLDITTQALMQLLVKDVKGTGDSLLDRRKKMAIALTQRLATIRTSPDFSTSFRPFWDRLLSLATRVDKFWTFDPNLGGAPLDVLPEMPALLKIVVEVATTFAAMPTSDVAGAPPLPTVSDFTKTITDLKDALVGNTSGVTTKRKSAGGKDAGESMLGILLEPVTDALRTGKSPNPAYEVLIAEVFNVVKEIDNYTKAKDPGVYSDIRDYYRWAIANSLMMLAFLLKKADTKAAKNVGLLLGPIAAGEGVPRLVITGDWLPDPDCVPDDMLVDLAPGSTPIEAASGDLIPITVQAYVNFFRRQFLADLNVRYTAILGTIDLQRKLGVLGPKTDFPQPEALEAAKASVPQPARFKPVGGAAFIPKPTPGDPVKELYQSSDKTIAELKMQSVKGATGVYPPTFQLESPVYAWIVPPLDDLVAYLRGPADSPLAKTVAAAAGAGVTIAEGDTIGWLDALIAASKLDPTIVTQVTAKVTDAPDGLIDTIHKNVDLQRQLENDFRRIYVQRIRSPLGNWANSHHAYDLGERNQAMKQLFEFSANTPYQRRDDQLCLLILDLAPDYDKAFDTLDHTDIEIMPFLEKVIKATEDTPKQPVSRFLELVDDQAELDALLAKRDTAIKVRDRIIEQRKALQKEFGIRSVDGRTLQGYVFSNPIEPKDEFMIDGIAYMLIKVHRPFVFHPGLKDPAPTDPIYKETEKGPAVTPSGQALFTIIAIEGEESGAKFINQITKPGDIWEEKYTGRLDDEGNQMAEATDPEPERFVVTDRHIRMLGHLSYVVEMRANQIGLEDTVAVLEFVSQIIITAAEIFLPGGQVIGVMETMASVAAILGDPDMQELITELFDDPKVFFSKIWGKIKAGFTLSGLVDLLLGSGKFADWLEALAGLTGRDDKRHKVESQPTGMFGRVVRFLVHLGRKLAEIFRKARHLLRGPLERLHAAVVTRPKLAWFIDTAVDLAVRAAEFLYDHPAVLDIATDLTAWVHESLVNFLRTIEQIELPKEIIPMDQVVVGGLAFLIDYIVGKIPKLKIVKPVLKATGLDVKIAEKINSIFHLDRNDVVQIPNLLYRKFVKDNIDPAFIDFRNFLVDDLVAVINIGSDKLKSLTGLDVGQVTSPGHEDVKPGAADMLSAYPAQGETAEATTAEIPKVAGRPLDDDMRIAVEKAFGQDFGHVRMHGDAPADRMARNLGAHALTTGSHVYVRSDLNLNSPFGRRVLDHELAHVIQATGTRPLGTSHGTTATTPPPRAPLSLDIHKEAAADRLAALATGSGKIPSHLKATGDLLQPFLFGPDLLQHIVGTVTHLNGEGEFEEKPVPGEEVQGFDQARAVWTSFKATTRSKAKLAPFMTAVKDSVLTQLLENSKVGDDDIKKVAELAQKTLPRAEQTDDVRTKLDVGHFATLLEGFLYARCGVAVQIKGPDDKSTEVTEVTIGYLHLALVGGTSKLWKAVMADAAVTKIDSDTAALQLEIRQRLTDLGPQAFIWDSSSFKFSSGFLDDLAALKAMRASAGKPNDVPAASDYADPASTAPSGLRLGVHGTLRKGGIGKFARESHHTTQFLLVEYFRNRVNDDKLKAFPPPLASYRTALSIKTSGDLIDSVVGNDLGTLDPGSGRGDKMPAILIAAETHRKGRLHINTSDAVDDDPDASPLEPDQGGTQGDKVQTWFRKGIGPELAAAHATNDGAKFGDAIKADATATLKIIAGMRNAYERMYESHMLARLADGLRTVERPYYEGIAARTHTKDDKLDTNYQLTPKLLDPIIAKAESNNRAVFDAKWKR